MEKQKKNIQMHFRVTPEEEQIIRRRMELMGIRSIGAYLRKMALCGYCINMDMSSVMEMVHLLRINSNNINQYAKRANESESIYKDDIADIQKFQKDLWDRMGKLIDTLSKIE